MDGSKKQRGPDVTASAVCMLSDRSMKSLKKAAGKPGLIDSYLTQKIHQAKPGELHLIPSEFTDISNLDNLSASFFIEEGRIDDTTLGVHRSQSIRNVKFGRMCVYSSGNTPIQTYVAAKPARSIECAVREAAASTMINNSQFDIAAYAPVGFLRTEGQSVTLLTRYTGRTLSFDNILWLNPETEYEDEVRDALGKGAVSLATLHAGFHMTHGDSQPKNIAWDPKRDMPWAIDLEDARRHTGQELLTFGDSVKRDIATLMLTQFVLRSDDLFEYVADEYLAHYEQLTGGEPAPITRDTIVNLRRKPLEKPFVVDR